jgi:GNAT superfamily N-acetyltransferase
MTILKRHHNTTAATVSDAAAISDVLTAAFWDDPVFRWAIPDDGARRAALPPLFEVFADGFIPLGATWTTRGRTGAALWAPPGTEANLSGLEPWIATGEWPRMLEVMELLESTHPHEPCWYLNLLAVRPSAQGRGIGGALLQRVLSRADADGVPAYLEATSPDNRRLYERFGFEATAELRTSDCPPLWAMWRRPVSTSHVPSASVPSHRASHTSTGAALFVAPAVRY